MKKAILLLLLAATALAFGGCFRQGTEPERDASRASTIHKAEANIATRDEATNDEVHRATYDEAFDNMLAAAEHPMNWHIDKSFFQTKLKHSTAQLKTVELLQNPELPTGCESVAVTAALQTLGFSPEKTDFAEQYLTYGEDVMWDYVGDPTDWSGAGIFAPGLTDCTNRYLQAQTPSKYAAYNTMGVELEDLLKLIDAGYPVVMWTTMDYELPVKDEVAYYYAGEYYYWYYLEHCVLLCGYDTTAGTVTISDPLQGIITMDLEQIRAIYDETGKMSLTIKDREPGTVFTGTVPTRPTTRAVSTSPHTPAPADKQQSTVSRQWSVVSG